MPEARRFLLLDLYRKGEQDDLAADERRLLRDIAERFKAAAIATVPQFDDRDE